MKNYIEDIKGDYCFEYAITSLADVLTIVENTTDIVVQSKELQGYTEYKIKRRYKKGN